MDSQAHKLGRAASAALIAASVGAAGCGPLAAKVFDAPPPPPLEQVETAAPGAPVAPPPAPAAAPAPAPAPIPTLPVAAPAADELLAFLAGWRDAWAGRDVAAYLQHYHPEFKGQTVSPAQWRSARQRIIGRAGQIELVLGQPEIRREGSDRAWLTFEQRYRSQALRDDGIKQLQLRKVDGRWLIEQEVFTPRQR